MRLASAIATLVVLANAATASLPTAAASAVKPMITAKQIADAMHSSAGLPQMPDAATLGAPAADLQTLNGALTLKQAQQRHDDLVNHLQAAYPNVSWPDFAAWAAPLYSAFIKGSQLDHVSMYTEQAFLRQLLFGLNVVAVMNMQASARLNHFAVLDPLESRLFTGFVPPALPSASALPDKAGSLRSLFVIPAAYDMRTVGAMPPIRNQGSCGACWAFAAAATLQIQEIFANKAASPDALSEQQLISCDTYDAGCSGGNPAQAWAYTADAGGLTTDAVFPYTMNQGTCPRVLTGKTITTTRGAISYINNDVSTPASLAQTEQAIMLQVMAGNPVTIAIAASSACFQFYGGGVLSCTCDGYIDHVVVIVGFDAVSWIVRNSWSTMWGDQGYGYLPREVAAGTAGTCNMYAYQPMYLSFVRAVGQTSTLKPTPQPIAAVPKHGKKKTRARKPAAVKATRSPTPLPTQPTQPTQPVEYESQCPPATPLFCGTDRAQPCCAWLPLGGGVYSNEVCCPSGMCVQSNGACPTSGRGLRAGAAALVGAAS